MYKLTKKAVIRLADSAVIPEAEGNADYQEYLAWVAKGNVLPLFVELPPDPEVLKETVARKAAKQNVKLQALADLSPAEVQAWVEANVKTLPDAKDLLATLAVAVSILAKQI